jgi:DNA-entry nuclease
MPSGSQTTTKLFVRHALVADSLGGDATLQNLVTGTRTQNVGSTQVDGQFAGGMAYTELIARDYLDSPAAKNCPLYYAATPVYTGDELLPRTVNVDVLACNSSIDMRVVVDNAAKGWALDYSDGSFIPATS